MGLDPDPKNKISAILGNKKSLNSNNENEIVSWCMALTNNIGVDGFLITTATKSNNPIEIASQSCRKRGRIILMGTSGININREHFYKKELTFKVSCSYGYREI